MKKKTSFILIILIAFITIPILYSKCSFVNSYKKTLVIKDEKDIKETSSSFIDSNEIIYTSDKSIDLVKDDTINLELYLKDNELNTPYSLTICFMKVEANMNKGGIINLIGSLDNLNTYSDVLAYKTLDIEKKITTSFDVESDGKYIVFIIDKEKIINPSNFDVKCEFAIGGENGESDSSIIGL